MLLLYSEHNPVYHLGRRIGAEEQKLNEWEDSGGTKEPHVTQSRTGSFGAGERGLCFHGWGSADVPKPAKEPQMTPINPTNSSVLRGNRGKRNTHEHRYFVKNCALLVLFR